MLGPPLFLDPSHNMMLKVADEALVLARTENTTVIQRLPRICFL